MRKIIINFLFLFLFLLIKLNTLSSQSFTNGGFESQLSGWTTETTNSSSATFNIISTNSPHSGTKMLEVNVSNRGTSQNSVKLSQPINTEPERIYMVRFWAKSAQSNSRMLVSLLGENTSKKCEFRIDDKFGTWTNGWQMYQYLFTTADTEIEMVVTFNTVGTFYIDDFELFNDSHQVLDLKTQLMWQNNLKGYGWVSGDNDVSVKLPDGRVAWIFSDSFLGWPNPNENYLRESTMINNLMVLEDENGNLTSYYQGTQSSPSALAPAPPGSVNWIGDGIIEDGKLKVMYNEWKGLDFNNRAAVVVFTLPDLVKGRTTIPSYSGSDIPNALLKEDDYIYIYTEQRPGGFTRYTRIARVPTGKLDSNSTPWEFYTSSGTWDTDITKAFRIVNSPGCSVRKLGEGNYVMSGVPNLSNEFALWFSETPWGPWGHKTVIYRMPKEEGVLFYLAHIHNRPDSELTGIYTLSYSLYPFGGYVPQQMADKGTYLPNYLKANLLELSPYTTKSNVSKIQNNVKYKFYPNPVIDILNIEGNENNAKIQVFDLKGSQVIEENSTKINMSNLDAGIYFVKTENATIKIIKK